MKMVWYVLLGTCETFMLPNSVISNSPCDDFDISYTLRGVMYN